MGELVRHGFSVSVASAGETARVGTCRAKVLGGTVDHRDTLLTDPERDNGMMLICISRAAAGSHLTLDL